MLTQALPTAAAWARFFMDADIPVLNATTLAIARLRKDEDRIGPREITAEVLLDPLMTLKVLAYTGARHRRSQSGDAETIEAALLMSGTTPFFRDFANMPVIEETLFKGWRLSTLLQRLTSDDHIEHPQVKTVQLATSLARHSANGWDDPALPDDYRGIAALLNVTPEWVIERVCEPTTEPASG